MGLTGRALRAGAAGGVAMLAPLALGDRGGTAAAVSAAAFWRAATGGRVPWLAGHVVASLVAGYPYAIAAGAGPAVERADGPPLEGRAGEREFDAAGPSRAQVAARTVLLAAVHWAVSTTAVAAVGRRHPIVQAPWRAGLFGRGLGGRTLAAAAAGHLAFGAAATATARRAARCAARPTSSSGR